MIKIRHINNHIYEATNGKDIIIIDPKKYTPVDMFITGLANCSAYDVVELSKAKGEIENFTLEVEYKRKEIYPKIFTEFHFIYSFNSKADNMTARRWVLSSLETYCSTINTVRNTSKIYYTIKHNGETIAFKESILSGQTHKHNNEDFEEDDGFGCIA
ncbi:OsmC family protein [Lebetimonas sp. JH292]|uniref:OsmC family protein n=1 Tax=Lebetimonas sp. JH292 TaxID=990068 RepID=UPI0004B73AB8|nr:OsmC family protein [Lebetimonas sp. JH292]